MTSLRSLLDLSSFRSAVEMLFELDETEQDEFRLLLGSTQDGNASVDPRARSAFGILYQAAADEGIEEVMSDVRTSMPEASDSQLSGLRNFLEPDQTYTERLEVRRQRDGFLPILRSTRMALDLRIVDVDGGHKLAPLVTCRMEFDEHVGGADAVVFQIPLSALGSLQNHLKRISDSVESLGNDGAGLAIPAWSKESAE